MRDISRAELTIFSMEKISFSLKPFSGHFMGNPSLRLSKVLYHVLYYTQMRCINGNGGMSTCVDLIRADRWYHTRVKSGRFGHQVNSDTHLQTV